MTKSRIYDSASCRAVLASVVRANSMMDREQRVVAGPGCRALRSVVMIGGRPFLEELDGARAKADTREVSTNRAFQNMLDTVPGAWFFTRRDGTFAYVNDGACAALGYTKRELLAATIFDIDPDARPELWQSLWTGTGPRDAMVVRARHRRWDGSIFPVQVHASRVFVEGEELAASYTVDLTATEHAEQVNRRLAAAVAHAAEAVVVMDAEGRVEFVNPAYQRSTGIAIAEALGRLWLELEVRGIDEIESALGAVLGEGAPWHGRYRGSRPNGTAFWEEANIAPIRDAGERIVGCVAVKRDITAQTELETQLRHSQKMDAVGQLAGSIAHDFNNLLQVIQGNAMMLARSRNAEQSDQYLKEVLTASDRAVRLVRQLLSFSRKDTTEQSPIDLVPAIGSMIEMFRRLLGSHIRVSWEPRVSRAVVRGNVAQLEQVVMNLCINSRDAMPDGGELSLTLDEADAELLPSTLRAPAAGPYYRLSVRDTGCGIAPENLERVFEPFFTSKAPGKGTGLGLATVYSIIEAHRGTVDLQSELGVGTSFYVYLPSSSALDFHEQPSPSTVAAVGAGRAVLVADDEDAVRRLTVRYLQEAGFKVFEAADGAEAIRQIKSHNANFELAVIDAMMPNCNGFQVYEAIRGLGLALPVLFVTGHDFATLLRYDDEPRVGRLQKPFDAVTLLTKVHTLIDPASRGADSSP